MDVSRLGFIRGVIASLGLGALGGGRIFAAPPGWKPPKTPNLVFGVISDTHLRTVGGPSGRPGHNWPNKYFAAALKYFREQNVDAVVHCGDFAHRGQVEEMQFHAAVWRKVFPRNLAPDGHEVVKLFVTGNHDTDGAGYGEFVAQKYPDPAVRARHVLQTDMAANWERIWGERYEPVWHKEVKGYHFFGRNFRVGKEELVTCLKRNAAVLSESKAQGRPFFYMQHSRPLWDVRKVLLHLSRGASPMSFFGHNHWSAASWNIISLYKGCLPCIQVPSCEPRGCGGLVGDAWITKGKLEWTEQAGKGRQGYIVRIYDDMLVIGRREFGVGGALGSDWVVPLEDCKAEGANGKAKANPLSKDELKKVIGEPQFREGAKVEVSSNSTTPQSIKISIPTADGNPKCRVYAYEVEIKTMKDSAASVQQQDSRPSTQPPNGLIVKAVYAAGVNLGMGHEPDVSPEGGRVNAERGVTTLEIAKSELPRDGKFTMSVTPLTSLGTRGRPITADV